MNTNRFEPITLLIAAVASLVMVLCPFHIKGIGVLYEAGIALWLSWIGIYIGQMTSFPKWARIASMVCGLCLIAYMACPSQIEGSQWAVAAYVLMGMSVPKNYEPKNRPYKELIALFAVFGILFVVCALSGHRANATFKWMVAVKFIPLLGSIYYALQLVVSQKARSISLSKFWKGICIAICVAAFVITLIDFAGMPKYSVLSLIVCPMTGCLLIMGAQWIIRWVGPSSN